MFLNQDNITSLICCSDRKCNLFFSIIEDACRECVPCVITVGQTKFDFKEIISYECLSMLIISRETMITIGKVGLCFCCSDGLNRSVIILLSSSITKKPPELLVMCFYSKNVAVQYLHSLCHGRF